VELGLVLLNQVVLQPAPSSGMRLVGGPSSPWQVSWPCPKSVASSGGPFDSWEAERCILIGRRGVALD
jgi:hypothetical protein